MPNRILYAIADWDTVYETAATRKLKHLHWVPVPNKQDGVSYCRIMAEPDGLMILGAWLVLLEVASKMPRRGVLADSRGPLSVRDIAVRSRASMTGLQRAIDVLSSPEIGWITADPNGEPKSPNGEPKSANIDPEIEQNRTEQNRREENRNSERASGFSTAIAPPAARPPSQEDGNGPTASAGATPASERGERFRPGRILVDRAWQAMQERFPRVDRGMAERVACAALDEIRANGLSPADLEQHIGVLVRNATRPHMRGAGMYLQTIGEEIRSSLVEIPDEVTP